MSYAIGVALPLSVHVDTYGTGTIPDKEILAAVLKNFDFRPGVFPSPAGPCLLHEYLTEISSEQNMSCTDQEDCSSLCSPLCMPLTPFLTPAARLDVSS